MHIAFFYIFVINYDLVRAVLGLYAFWLRTGLYAFWLRTGLAVRLRPLSPLVCGAHYFVLLLESNNAIFDKLDDVCSDLSCSNEESIAFITKRLSIMPFFCKVC